MRKFGLIGNPLSHSFSKKYFSEKFEKEGIINCSYDLYPLNNIQELPALLKKEPLLEGLNVTIPYKQAVLPFLTNTTYLPLHLQACNCIKIKNGELIGYNTDTIGFEKSFAPLLLPHHKHALILGGGGAAVAVKAALERLSIPYLTAGRSLKPGINILYTHLLESHIVDASIIINTTPLGTFPDIETYPPIPYQFITSKHYLYDLVYNPAQTSFLQKGASKGAITKNGYDMLMLQAEAGWELWNS